MCRCTLLLRQTDSNGVVQRRPEEVLDEAGGKQHNLIEVVPNELKLGEGG